MRTVQTVPIEVREIMEILPHRFPLLLLDRIVAFEPNVRAVAYKMVAANEPVFSGHFPEQPILPGIYQIEALAQLGGTIAMTPTDYKRKMAYLVGVDKFKFRRPVVPGDRLEMEAVLLRKRSNLGWIKAEARVDGKLVCSGELAFAIAPIVTDAYSATIFSE